MADKIELPDSVQVLLLKAGTEINQLASGELQLAMARQRDGATYDQRVLGAVAAVELLVSDDPMQIAGLNTGIRTPTTISHPSMQGSGTTPT